MPRLEPATLQGANRFKTSENANHSIVFSCIWNCVDMRTSANRSRCWIRSRPTRKSIPNCILAQCARFLVNVPLLGSIPL